MVMIFINFNRIMKEVKSMENKEVVKIVNMKQAGLYIKHGLTPLNIYYDNKLIMEFDKNESNPLYTLWLKHELV